MPNTQNIDKTTPANETVNEYNLLLDKVKTYWRHGDAVDLVKSGVHERMKLKKGYLKIRISQVLCGAKEDYNVLIEMYNHILPRKTAIEKALLDSVHVRTQKVND